MIFEWVLKIAIALPRLLGFRVVVPYACEIYTVPMGNLMFKFALCGFFLYTSSVFCSLLGANNVIEISERLLRGQNFAFSIFDFVLV